MSHRQTILLAAVAALAMACVSTEAFAWRGHAAHYGGVGVRGGAVAARGAVYGRGYYRPGVRLAAGAVVGGAIAAGYGYGGYGYGGYPYDSSYYENGPGYTAAPSPAPVYNNGYDPGYSGASYAAPASYRYGSYGYGGGCSTDPIMCGSQCWLNDNGANYRWGDCPAVNHRVH